MSTVVFMQTLRGWSPLPPPAGNRGDGAGPSHVAVAGGRAVRPVRRPLEHVVIRVAAAGSTLHPDQRQQPGGQGGPGDRSAGRRRAPPHGAPRVQGPHPVDRAAAAMHRPVRGRGGHPTRAAADEESPIWEPIRSLLGEEFQRLNGPDQRPKGLGRRGGPSTNNRLVFDSSQDTHASRAMAEPNRLASQPLELLDSAAENGADDLPRPVPLVDRRRVEYRTQAPGRARARLARPGDPRRAGVHREEHHQATHTTADGGGRGAGAHGHGAGGGQRMAQLVRHGHRRLDERRRAPYRHAAEPPATQGVPLGPVLGGVRALRPAGGSGRPEPLAAPRTCRVSICTRRTVLLAHRKAFSTLRCSYKPRPWRSRS